MRSAKNNVSARMMGLAGLVTALTWTTAPMSLAQSRARTVTLDQGTVIPVRLNDPLSSKDSEKGDTFTTTVKTEDDRNDDGYADYAALPVGTKIEGVVLAAREKRDKDPGVLEMEFRRVRLPNGRSYAIDGSLIGLDNKSVERTRDGRLVAKPSKKNDRLAYVGYGAGAGLIVGLLTKRPLENIILGAGLGYLFGSLQKGGSDTRDVSLKAGTELGVRLDRRLTFTASYDDSEDRRYRDDDRRDRDEDPSYYRRNRDNRDRDNDRDGEYDYSRNRADRDRDDRNSSTNIGVLINDRDVRFDSTARPVMTNGVVMLPVRTVLDAARVGFTYDGERRVIRASGEEGVVRLAVGSRIAVVNGNRRVRLEAPAQILNGTAYVPMEFLELATGQDVRWDEGSRTVVITPERPTPADR